MTNTPYIAFAWAWDSVTRSHSRQVSYEARNRQEAVDWCRFNAAWMRDFRLMKNDGGNHPLEKLTP